MRWGDVETNPGPLSDEPNETSSKIYAVVATLKSDQDNMIKELRELTEKRKRTDQFLHALSERVSTLESQVAACGVELRTFQEAVKNEVRVLNMGCDDAESRSR